MHHIRSNYFGKAPDFLALAKPRVMSLAIFTAVVGMMTAPGNIDTTMAIFATIAIAVGAVQLAHLICGMTLAQIQRCRALQTDQYQLAAYRHVKRFCLD